MKSVPRPIGLFAAAYALVVILNLIGAIMADSLRFSIPEIAIMLGAAFMPTVLGIRLAFTAWLGWLIVWRRNNIAKWAVVALIALRLPAIVDVWDGLWLGDFIAILWAAGTALGLVAVTCLFVTASRRWFAAKGRLTQVDAAIFD